MDNSILILEVDYWDKHFADNPETDSKIFELAFFKIFVKFELFVSELFVHYCTGNQSIYLYNPARRLNFDDRQHFDGVIKNSNSTFIDYFSRMHDLIKHIFVDDDSPFIILSDPEHAQNLNEMKIIRNYIAHESMSSKKKYTQQIVNSRYMEPYEYLLKINRGTGISNYTKYVNSMVVMSNFLLGPIPLVAVEEIA